MFSNLESRSGFFSKYLEICGLGYKLVSIVTVVDTMASVVHWMLEWGVWSLFRR